MTPDVIVAGGGPVGLTAALYAARSGLSVTVLEPRSGHVDKACGEGLMPGAVAALADLGVRPPGYALTGVRYLAAGRTAEATFGWGHGLGVRRTTLNAALREAIDAVGVEVLPSAAGVVSQDSTSVTVWLTAGSGSSAGGAAIAPLRARFLIAADGLHSPVRRRLGLEAAGRGPWRLGRWRLGLRRFGLRQHHVVRPWSDHVEVYWGTHAEAYVTPVDEDLVGVALLTTRRLPFEAQLREFTELRERLGSPDVRLGVRGAGPLRQRSTRRVAGRVLLAGDASGYVDALTGEGIAVGMAQARAAVAAVASGRPEAYERLWRQVTWRYAVLTGGLVRATRIPLVRRALVPAAGYLPRVFDAAVHELARPAGDLADANGTP